MSLTKKFKGKAPKRARFVLLGILALELASLPAAAHMIAKVDFTPKDYVIAIEIPNAPDGVKRFLVKSNNGFAVEASGDGQIDISVHQSGLINTTRFGDSSQLPGQVQGCVHLGEASALIYQAEQGTAAEKDIAVAQSVVFEFAYDSDQTPEIEFHADELSALPARSCLKLVDRSTS